MTLTSHKTPVKPPAKYLSHLRPNEQAGLTAFVDGLHQHYGPDLLRVVLFGSKACGDFDNESDLDILVVVRMPDGDYWQHWHKIVDLAWEIELAHSLVMSLVIKDEPDYTKMCEHRSLLIRNIEQEGIELWTTSLNEPTSKPI